MADELKKEFVFTTYCKDKSEYNKDALFLKEIIHHPDGTKERKLSRIDNYKRPYWITKPQYRNHEDKKEFEYIEKLDCYYTNQANLYSDIFHRLNGYKSNSYVRKNEITASQFVYGIDTPPGAILRDEYIKQHGLLQTEALVAALDFEWDVVDGTDMIIAGAISLDDRIHLAATRKWLKEDEANANSNFLTELRKQLGKIPVVIRKEEKILNYDFVESFEVEVEADHRKVVVKFDIVDNAGQLVMKLLKSAHEWKPDFVTTWNLEVDIDHMVSALECYGYDPAFAFSDPSVPPEFHYFEWRKDTPFKMNANGDQRPKAPSERWHTVIAPASFYFVCSMALFRLIRAREQQRTSYALDPTLKSMIGSKKLKTDKLPEGLDGLEWHVTMQKDFKLDYLVYLAYDVISMNILDQTTKDVRSTFRGYANVSEFNKFKSNPGKLTDDYHFSLQDEGKVVGSTSSNMRTELDDLCPNLRNWISTLAAELEHEIGLRICKDLTDLRTNITAHAFDIDVTSAYPSTEVAFNLAKHTRVFETCSIDNFTEAQQRSIGINMTSVKVNCLSLATTCYDYPDLDMWLSEFNEHLEETA